ncbi:MAG: leucine-rich repeat domain-containing protein [Candidatus Helarchaeota archaeon]
MKKIIKQNLLVCNNCNNTFPLIIKGYKDKIFLNMVCNECGKINYDIIEEANYNKLIVNLKKLKNIHQIYNIEKYSDSVVSVLRLEPLSVIFYDYNGTILENISIKNDSFNKNVKNLESEIKYILNKKRDIINFDILGNGRIINILNYYIFLNRLIKGKNRLEKFNGNIYIYTINNSNSLEGGSVSILPIPTPGGFLFSYKAPEKIYHVDIKINDKYTNEIIFSKRINFKSYKPEKANISISPDNEKFLTFCLSKDKEFYFLKIYIKENGNLNEISPSLSFIKMTKDIQIFNDFIIQCGSFGINILNLIGELIYQLITDKLSEINEIRTCKNMMVFKIKEDCLCFFDIEKKALSAFIKFEKPITKWFINENGDKLVIFYKDSNELNFYKIDTLLYDQMEKYTYAFGSYILIEEAEEISNIMNLAKKAKFSFMSNIALNDITPIIIKKFISNKNCFIANNQGRIYLLNIKNFGLDTFPSFFNLSELRYLNLRNNKLKEFPFYLKTLKNLKLLDLSKNYLTEIPEEISDLNFLEYLDLSKNKIEKIPLDKIIDLPNLKYLDIRKNPICKKLKKNPDFKSKIKKLKKLKKIEIKY